MRGDEDGVAWGCGRGVRGLVVAVLGGREVGCGGGAGGRRAREAIGRGDMAASDHRISAECRYNLLDQSLRWVLASRKRYPGDQMGPLVADRTGLEDALAFLTRVTRMGVWWYTTD